MAIVLSPIQSRHSKNRNKPRQIFIHSILNSNPGLVQRFSAGTDPIRPELPVGNAYEILGVSETSSFEEIKASFRRLAKETHPDLAPHDQNDDAASSSSRFIQILAAYEILSDSMKRGHYDKYLLSRRELAQNQMHFMRGSKLHVYRSKMTSCKQREVVEWLKWYRFAINEIVLEKKVVAGTGYFDVLESDFYAAIRMAYYGPEIESLDLLPDRFEAEERSIYETPEVLHLVSGRDLFGIVCLVNTIPKLSPTCTQRLNNFTSSSLGICEANGTSSISFSSNTLGDDIGVPNVAAGNSECQKTDAYKDLELHVSGKLVALATRIPPKRRPDGINEEDALDQIRIFLCIDSNATCSGQGFFQGSFLGGAIRSTIPLGTIMGLGTSPEEGSCFVYDSSGTKTHVIMKHRTLLVKHMHWYRVEDKVSVCECRCSRARLPPSKFWLFEPRCGMHDIGGWYVEMFGRDKKGRTVPSQRYWDGPEIGEEYEKRLHPAMYLLALAYRTLDLELAKRRKRTMRDIVEGQAYKVLQWCKKLV